MTTVMRLLKMILKATGEKGVPQGGVISPVLSNLYLTEVDRMLEKAIATTRYGKYTSVQYARFADDLVILIDSHPRHDWLRQGGGTDDCGRKWLNSESRSTRTRAEWSTWRKAESFTFLGFEYRRILQP